MASALEDSLLSLFPRDNPSDTIIATDAIRYVRKGIITVQKTYGPLLERLVEAGYREYQVNDLPERRTSAGCDLSQQGQKPTLFVFAYDWRQDNADSAAALKDYIGCIQKFHPGQPVNLLAHSMGGLVARRYIIDNSGTHQVAKLVTIGSPWLGAPKAVNVLETGDFVDWIITDKTMKYIAGSATGAHQLLPSKAYFVLGGGPVFGENGLDLDGDGLVHEAFTYNDYSDLMDSLYGYDSYDSNDPNKKHEFWPGTASRNFHSYPNDTYLQDDWRNDTSGVEYYHFYGVRSRLDTIGQTLMVRKSYCIFKACKTRDYAEKKFTEGDETVPTLSARRIWGDKNYNVPGATLYEVMSANKSQDDEANHLGMTKSTVVQDKILSILGISTGQLQVQDNGIRIQEGDSVQATAMQPAHYLTVIGGDAVIVSDAAGNSTAPISDTVTFRGEVPGVTTYSLGEQAEMIILSPTDTYAVTFQTNAEPMGIELETGIGEAITAAVRYQDLVLPANVKAELRFSPAEMEDLRYDSNGDNVPDTSVTPTVSVSGPQAADTTPPTLSVAVQRDQSGTIVIVTAEDTESGVKAVKYSLDGTIFEIYTAAVQVDPEQTPVFYAFADDNLANRSSLLTYQLQNSRIYLPIILK